MRLEPIGQGEVVPAVRQGREGGRGLLLVLRLSLRR